MIKYLLLPVALITLCTDAALACSMPWMPWSRVVRSTMTVQSGKPCEIWFRSAGPMPNIRIVKRAAHGSVSVGSANKVIYQSRAGYSGRDDFVYEHSGRNSLNTPVKATVMFAVTVTR